MKHLLVTILVLGLVLYLHRQQKQENFILHTEINSLKYKGRSYEKLLDD